MGTSEQKIAQNYIYIEVGPFVMHFHKRGHWALEYVDENTCFKVRELSSATAAKLEHALSLGREQMYEWAQEDEDGD